ncbi:MAG: hypothetical protein N2045_13200 [Fimbriimonadales bacterium]|jgi:threonine/homoserine/homoserine lactone efflux protein|nr:hypothetical protein [Fimbriimonadales bacterium]GBC90420.1 hypothetical protein HRbin14_01155 [bacterium HR14]GIV12963.1 MAG: hypothetical protein KatS3mg021_1245 [Fimbriimonadales bacterium]CUU10009.1 hypothetical protein GBSOP10_10634 [Armatimonadetes bacterium GBS]CUU34741.1 hypothetical protein GXSOP10_11824 [Armatimonadetes bacterium GXS]
MNQWVRLGLAVLIVVLLLSVGLRILSVAIALVRFFFPLLVLVGAGLILYGLIRHFRARALRSRNGYPPLED